jgi:beta-galactosidase
LIGASSSTAGHASLATLALVAAQVSAQPIARDRSFELDDDWRFVLVNDSGIDDPTSAYDGAFEPDFDASDWRTVTVPHDWSIEHEPREGDGTSAGSGFLPGGLAWYRKRFVLPASVADGTRVFLEFDGVYMDSYVYVNGELVGNHPYGYTGFAFDITDRVVADGTTENLIAVRVQNQLPSSRWYSGSGIYRNARIVITDAIHVARHGLYVTTPHLADSLARNRATVHVEAAVINQSGRRRSLRIVSHVLDATGTERAAGESSATVDAGSTATATTDIELPEPMLWSPSEPALYTLVTQVYAGRRLADVLETRFGVRSIDIDPDTGLTVNGRATKIKGVNLHHDLGALGAAVNRDALLRQMTIMKSMGVNAVRTAHNSPAPELVEVCE